MVEVVVVVVGGAVLVWVRVTVVDDDDVGAVTVSVLVEVVADPVLVTVVVRGGAVVDSDRDLVADIDVVRLLVCVKLPVRLAVPPEPHPAMRIAQAPTSAALNRKRSQCLLGGAASAWSGTPSASTEPPKLWV